MAHQIEENDLTYSTSGPEWMGLAAVRKPEEMADAVSTLFFPIVEGEASVTIDGVSVPLLDPDSGKGWKVIAADCRNLPQVAERAVHPPAIVPLHIPKQSYAPIENERAYEAICDAFDKAGIEFTLSTCGTLGNLTRFYLSVALEGLNVKCPRGFDIQSYLTLMTSHNGTHDLRIMDSHIKPVCANTVNAIMRNHGDLSLNVRHTKNADLEITDMSERVADFMTGAADLEIALATLDGLEADTSRMESIAAGFFVLPAVRQAKKVDLDKLGMSTQSRNAVTGIVDLAANGKGNTGKTLYDLMNGATDYWSNGDGIGNPEKVSLAKRVYRSRFGKASEHKTGFTRYLMSEDDRKEGEMVGAKVLANYERDRKEKLENKKAKLS